MSNTFNIPRYTPTLWEEVTPVQPPDVTALIKHTYNGTITELITETNIHSKLVVPQHSLLVLTCLAIYPIMWYKDGKLVPGQVSAYVACMRHACCLIDHWIQQARFQISFKPSPLYNPALQRLMPQAHHNYSDQDYTNSSIQMWATGYQATLRFENVTKNVNGTYECKGTTVEDDAFKLALRINVNSTRGKNLVCTSAGSNNAWRLSDRSNRRIRTVQGLTSWRALGTIFEEETSSSVIMFQRQQTGHSCYTLALIKFEGHSTYPLTFRSSTILLLAPRRTRLNISRRHLINESMHPRNKTTPYA